MNDFNILDKQIDPLDDGAPVAFDFEDTEIYSGQYVWIDCDGNYIDEELVTPYFERYLRFMGAKIIEIGD